MKPPIFKPELPRHLREMPVNLLWRGTPKKIYWGGFRAELEGEDDPLELLYDVGKPQEPIEDEEAAEFKKNNKAWVGGTQAQAYEVIGTAIVPKLERLFADPLAELAKKAGLPPRPATEKAPSTFKTNDGMTVLMEREEVDAGHIQKEMGSRPANETRRAGGRYGKAKAAHGKAPGADPE